MTPLRLEMISALTLKNYAPSTIKSYVSHVAKYAKYHGRCPSKLGPDEVKTYLLQTLSCNYSSSHYRQIVSSLSYLYKNVLGYDWMLPHIPFPRKAQRNIPEVPTLCEISQVLTTIEDLRERALVSTLYGTGMRLFELQELQARDIKSKPMLVHIRKGKWDKERHTLLPHFLLLLLREYYRENRPKKYLFEGKKGVVSASVVRRVCKRAGKQAGLSMVLTPRILRHAFATHLYEAGEKLITIQSLLGHAHLITTQIYTHVSTEHLSRIESPLDKI